MESINDNLFNSFEDSEIENLESIQVRGGGATKTGRWSLSDGAGNYISCASDSAVNSEPIAGYDCTCANHNTGTVGPC